MGHPQIENQTPFAFEPLFLADEEGCPILVPIVKATYAIGKGGRLSLAETQRPIDFTGERWDTTLESSSYKYEPETAFVKTGTDVVLIASAYARNTISREVEVSLRVGLLEKRAHIIGDRTWVKRIGGGISMTDARPFERMPLVYERAFGGWDRSHADPEKHAFEPRNPVGTGFRKHRSFDEGVRLPNIEDPKRRLKSYGDVVPPTGFGFVSPDWQPRATLAGTYDDTWAAYRMPLLPRDFDRRFFNAGSPGLMSAEPLRGDEPVTAHNVTPTGELAFRLPRVPRPRCTVHSVRGPDHSVETRLDTVIVNAEESLLLLLWRSSAPVAAEPHGIRTLQITVDGVPSTRSS